MTIHRQWLRHAVGLLSMITLGGGLLACTTVNDLLNPNAALSDTQVTQYIQAYHNLRTIAPNLGAPSSHSPPNLQGINPTAVEEAVRAAGLAGTAEFLVLSARIGAALSVVEAEQFAHDIKARSQATAAKLQQALQDPLGAAAAQAKVQAQLEKTPPQLEGALAWAQRALDWVRGLSSDSSHQVVRRHRHALETAFAQ